MKSKTKIEKQAERKKRPSLVETILLAKKNKAWQEVAGFLAAPRRNKVEINLEKIEEASKDGDIIVVPGKVLSQGDISKKIKIVAMSFSEKAREKLLKCKSEILTISEEIKKNPEAKGVQIIK